MKPEIRRGTPNRSSCSNSLGSAASLDAVENAIITSGGVKVGEIDPKTMASKKIGGLYFAGEIIDVDAYTGGYNLQIAWATGKAAGEAAADALLTQ